MKFKDQTDEIMQKGINDAVMSLTNSNINANQAIYTNSVYSAKVPDSELEQIYKTGIGNKVVRIKSASALKNGFVFDNDKDAQYYDEVLKPLVLDAVEKMIAFGRGIIAISQKGDKLTDPLKAPPKKPILRVFGGTDITVSSFDRDFDSPRFYKPVYYTAWGQTIHHSRVIDFTYIKPTDKDRPYFKFGGMSEFQLIYNEIICDGIVQRAGASFIEKSSSLIYKMKEYADYYQRGQESPVNKRVKEAEEKRGIFGALVVDSEDSVETIEQALQNLDNVDDISLRRLCMVTGIPKTVLVGEPVTGLNSSGENELSLFYAMIEGLQDRYIINPFNELLEKLGMGKAIMKKGLGDPDRIAGFEGVVLSNAQTLMDLGEDYKQYLVNKGLAEGDIDYGQ